MLSVKQGHKNLFLGLECHHRLREKSQNTAPTPWIETLSNEHQWDSRQTIVHFLYVPGWMQKRAPSPLCWSLFFDSVLRGCWNWKQVMFKHRDSFEKLIFKIWFSWYSDFRHRPQCSTKIFTNLSRSYGFVQKNSSPHFEQSNLEVKRTIQTFNVIQCIGLLVNLMPTKRRWSNKYSERLIKTRMSQKSMLKLYQLC